MRAFRVFERSDSAEVLERPGDWMDLVRRPEVGVETDLGDREGRFGLEPCGKDWRVVDFELEE